MNVEVKFGRAYRTCTIAGDGVCRHCHELIVWATTPNDKFIPLEPEEVGPGVMEPHFRNCAGRAPASTSGYAGIEMSEAIWKQLLRLVHPDKHHGGEDEHLANELTQWLISQRSRLNRN